MDREALRAHLAATFMDELEEHVRALNREALALERDAGAERPEILRTLFRAAHSLKGAARSAGVPPIEAVCHVLEELLVRARDGAVLPDAAFVQLLLAAADALEDAAVQLRSKRDPATARLTDLLVRLEAASAGPAPPAQARALLGAVTSSAAAPSPKRTAMSAGDSVSVRAIEAPQAASARAAHGSPPSTSRSIEGGVRLPAARLDALVARSGELLVARRRASAQEERIAELRDLASRCAVEWRVLEAPLRKLVASESEGRAPASKASSGVLPRRAGLALKRTREGLRKLERAIEALARSSAEDRHQLDQAAAPLEREVRRIRMLPFGEVCAGLERAVRDLSRASGKVVELSIGGAEVEIDRAILDGLRDPLLHLVRNAVDHGVEPPAERAARGKPPAGRVTVSATLQGSGVEIVVADDGRGLDPARIREQAELRGIAIPEGDAHLERLLFVQGFSTAPAVTEVSGRGVGLDVVKHSAEALHGAVGVTSEPGRGARFSLLVPLTLATLRAVLVRAGGETFALPATNVRKLLRVDRSELRSAGGRAVLFADASAVLAASLVETLGLPPSERPTAGARTPFVVVASGEREVAFAVDELLDQDEVAVKGLGRRLGHVRCVAGATPLATGRLALILAASELIDAALDGPTGASAPFAAATSDAPPARRRLLVVDDSVTTRSLVRSILEAAGFDVVTAPDGLAAWQILQERGADLVVADVEMPRMDGFELTETIRRSRRFGDLPVILVTALASEQDRARGLEAGARAYLPKSAFDQTQLLEAIHRML